MATADTSPPVRRRPLSGRSLAALLLIAAFAGIWLQPSGAILGHLRGEPFFAGYPSSYWNRQLDDGPGERSVAREQLGKGGQAAIPVLIHLLDTRSSTESASPRVRWTVAELIGMIGPDAGEARDALIAALEDPDPHVQGVAAFSIPQIQTPATDAVPPLTRLLRTQHVVPATRALSEYRGEAHPALEDLLVILQDDKRPTEDRWNAARTIGKIGPAAIDSLPVLIALTQDREATIREHSAEAIGDIGPTASAGIPALILCLEDPATRVRRDSVRSLGYLGSQARVAIPQMLRLLTDSEELVRHATQDALRTIAPEELKTWQAARKKSLDREDSDAPPGSR